MLAALVANLVSLVIDKHSFYDHLKKQYLRDVNFEKEESNEKQNLQAPLDSLEPESLNNPPSKTD
jgi:hypothetical protein